MKIILGSQSKNRLTLLTHLPLSLTVIKSTVDEDKIYGDSPRDTLQKRAQAKTDNIIKIITNRSNLPNAAYLIITADSGVIIGNTLLGKPADYNEAHTMLTTLAGKTHQFLTATSIVKLTRSGKSQTDINKHWNSLTSTNVTLRKLNKQDIQTYIKMMKKKILTVAGAYTLTDSPQNFITKVDGSVSNVIGLPYEVLIPILFEEKIL